MDKDIQANRRFMKSAFGTPLFGGASDQSKGLPRPLLQKPIADDAPRTALPKPDPARFANRDIHACMANRRSRRRWAPGPLSLDDLSLLLWATQGVVEVLDDSYATLRTVPSAGARHPFETYLAVQRVESMAPGIYRYLPLTHELALVRGPEGLSEAILAAAFGQKFVAEAPAVFFWSCVPHRGEWRYMAAAHKVMLIDAGHVCQNLYLACEALGAGGCAIGAYDQEAVDRLLDLDGDEEFVVYLAPVGRVQ